MNFTDAVINCFKNYATGDGRATRSEYWYWTLFCFLGSGVVAILDAVFFHNIYLGSWSQQGPLGALFSLLTLIPSFAVAIRRLHDVDRSGYWLLIGLTIIGLIFPLLVWNCTKGTAGTNRFGPDPLQRAPDSVTTPEPGQPL